MEAMNAGCCVLANSVGGIKEIIDNKTGYLIDCSDPDVLAAQIIYCYNNRDEIREKAICGKQKCATEFFDSVMARNVASLYREMLRRYIMVFKVKIKKIYLRAQKLINILF